MTDSMSLPKKQVSFFQRAMKIEVSENMVTPNIYSSDNNKYSWPNLALENS